MTTKPPVYGLFIYELEDPQMKLSDMNDLRATLEFESPCPFGPFNAGDTVTHGQALSYLGRIVHIHHWIGINADRWRHDTKLYCHPDFKPQQ